MMARNPWPISWLTGELTEDGDDERYSVEDQLAYLERSWREAVGDADHGSELDRAILRIRWGARAACRRLRAEVERLSLMVADLARRSRELVSERDTARRELAALEWLTRQGHIVGRGAEGFPVALRRQPDDAVYTGATWSVVATSLGWDGTVPDA